MPVSLVAPESQGSFWAVLRGLIMVHFGGPWTEQDKALYVVQLAGGDATVFCSERSFSCSNGTKKNEVLGLYGLREGESAELSAYDGSILLHLLGRMHAS